MVTVDELVLLERAEQSVACAECPCHVAVEYCPGCDSWLCLACWAEHNQDAPDHTEPDHVPPSEGSCLNCDFPVSAGWGS